MISASLIHKVGIREAAATVSSGSLKERAAKIGIVAAGAPDLLGSEESWAASFTGGADEGFSSASSSRWLGAGAKQEFKEEQLLRPRLSLPTGTRPGVLPSGPLPGKPLAALRGARPTNPNWRPLVPPAWAGAPGVKEEELERPLVGGGFAASPAGLLRPKTDKYAPMTAAERIKTELELVRESEKELKREEASARDLACRAICQIKHGLRERERAGLPSDFAMKDWDKRYQQHLGDYMAFLQSRPDQFRVVDGFGQGRFTLENVAGNITVMAPAWRSGARNANADSIVAKDPASAVKAEADIGFRFSPAARAPAPRAAGPRERLFDARIAGAVVRWCGGFGWVRPHTPIDHPSADKHGGDLFVHASDVIDAWSLDPGTEVSFIVYADKSGLGAEECRPAQARGAFKGGGKSGGRGKGKGKAQAADLALPAGSTPFPGGRGGEGPERPRRDRGDLGDEPPSALLSLRPLAPLRLRGRTTADPPTAAASLDRSMLGELDRPVEGEKVESDEAEEDDEVEAMGFVVEGEEASDCEEALGFQIDGEDDLGDDAAGEALGETAESSAAGFDIWSLITADDGEEEGAAATGPVVKRMRFGV